MVNVLKMVIRKIYYAFTEFKHHFNTLEHGLITHFRSHIYIELWTSDFIFIKINPNKREVNEASQILHFPLK